MATVTSLCTVFPILTPTLSKPHFVPLSSRTPKRSRIITSVAEDREIVPVSEDRGARSHEVEGIQPSESITEAEIDPRLTSSSTVNAFIVLGVGTFAVTKLLTIDHDYWHVSFNIKFAYFLLLLSLLLPNCCFSHTHWPERWSCPIDSITWQWICVAETLFQVIQSCSCWLLKLINNINSS